MHFHGRVKQEDREQGGVVKSFLFFLHQCGYKSGGERADFGRGTGIPCSFLVDQVPYTCLIQVRAWYQHFRRRCHNFESNRAGKRGRESTGPFHNQVMQFSGVNNGVYKLILQHYLVVLCIWHHIKRTRNKRTSKVSCSRPRHPTCHRSVTGG